VARRQGKSRWMQRARKAMEERGAVGAFGRATAKKIAAGKRKGGLAKKRAILAQNFKRIAQKRKKNRSAARR
jgi:hypothetical protein